MVAASLPSAAGERATTATASAALRRKKSQVTGVKVFGASLPSEEWLAGKGRASRQSAA